MTSKTIVTLIALVAIVGSISVASAATTFVGGNCNLYDPEMGAGKVCNDLNNLNDRVIELESITNDGLVTYVNITDGITIFAGAIDSVGVQCDNNDLVLSGGYSVNNEVTVSQSVPASNLSGWNVQFSNLTPDDHIAYMYALCLVQ